MKIIVYCLLLTAIFVLAIGGIGNNFRMANPCSGLPNNGQLKDLLLANSPLSDTVLIAFINRLCEVSPGIFKEIIIPNSPVSSNVRPHLLAYINTLPNGIKNQILDAQNSTQYRTVSLIQTELNSAIIQHSLLLNEALRYHISNDEEASAFNLLATNTGIDIKRTLAASYLQQGEKLQVQNVLNTMPVLTAEGQAFITLNNILLQLSTDSTNMYNIDSAQAATVRQIANTIECGIVKANAQALLHIVFGETFVDCDDFSVLKMANEELGQLQAANIEDPHYVGGNYPNPFSNNTYIPYYLPVNSGGYIHIFDVNGQHIQSYLLSEGYNLLELNTANWSQGIYTYSIEINSEVKETKRMILVK